MEKINSNGYKQGYIERKIIGRGNFGSATLVSPKDDPQSFFVAKKILMGSLKEKEQNSALLEAKLLKELNHTNIVNYLDSFVEDGTFIIIMEYCEGAVNFCGFS
jgi:serine/threonine protein kinase